MHRPVAWVTLATCVSCGVLSVAFPAPRNLQSFNTLVLGNAPLFQVETILTAPEIVLHPNVTEINKMCVHCIRSCVEITKVRAASQDLCSGAAWPWGLGLGRPRPPSRPLRSALPVLSLVSPASQAPPKGTGRSRLRAPSREPRVKAVTQLAPNRCLWNECLLANDPNLYILTAGLGPPLASFLLFGLFSK